MKLANLFSYGTLLSACAGQAYGAVVGRVGPTPAPVARRDEIPTDQVYSVSIQLDDIFKYLQDVFNSPSKYQSVRVPAQVLQRRDGEDEKPAAPAVPNLSDLADLLENIPQFGENAARVIRIFQTAVGGADIGAKELSNLLHLLSTVVGGPLSDGGHKKRSELVARADGQGVDINALRRILEALANGRLPDFFDIIAFQDSLGGIVPSSEEVIGFLTRLNNGTPPDVGALINIWSALQKGQAPNPDDVRRFLSSLPLGSVLRFLGPLLDILRGIGINIPGLGAPLQISKSTHIGPRTLAPAQVPISDEDLAFFKLLKPEEAKDYFNLLASNFQNEHALSNPSSPEQAKFAESIRNVVSDFSKNLDAKPLETLQQFYQKVAEVGVQAQQGFEKQNSASASSTTASSAQSSTASASHTAKSTSEHSSSHSSSTATSSATKAESAKSNNVAPALSYGSGFSGLLALLTFIII